MNRWVAPVLIVSMAAMSISGCASVTDVSAELSAANDVIPDAYPATATLPDIAAQTNSLSSLFLDPQLSDYLEQVLLNNRDLRTARLNARAASARLEQASARRWPRISVGADLGASTFLDDIDVADTAGISASLNYDPDLFNAVGASINSAALRSDIAERDAARLARVLLAQTATAYVQIIEADLQLRLAQENFEFLGETLRVSRARFEAGAIARADFALSEAEYENARASLVSQEFAAREARRTLAALLGDFADVDLRIAATLPALREPGLVVTGPRAAVLSRHDVMASALSVRAAASDLDATVAANLPGALLTGSLGNGAAVADLFDIDTLLARVGASISDTVFGAGEDAEEREARLRLDIALTAYETALREAYADLVSNLDRVILFEERLTALDTASRAAEQALELETIRYDLGEAILLDVLTVQRRVNTIRSEEIRSRATYLQAVIAAHLAAGPTAQGDTPTGEQPALDN